jgi:hypothetical protein
MFQVKTNLKAVAARLAELQAGVPGCVERALDPGWWKKRLRDWAEEVLTHQVSLVADPKTRADCEKLIPQILDTLMATRQAKRVLFTLRIPNAGLGQVDFEAAAKQSALAYTPTGRESERFQRLAGIERPETNLAAARQAVADWVEFEKHFDERDANRSTQDVIDHLEKILGLAPTMGSYRNDAMDEAAKDLVGAINAWLNGEPATPGGTPIQTPAPDPFRELNPERPQHSGITNQQAREWLTAVLDTWVIRFRLVVRDRIEAELKKLHARVGGRQPQLI